MSAKTSRHLFSSWSEIERRLRRADRVAVFTDFDGTLAPIAPTPDRVRLAPTVRQVLATLVRRDVLVGVISGRKLADLEARVAVPGIWYAGAHGYFVRRSGGPSRSLLDPVEKLEMACIRRRLSQRLRGIPGVLLEPKDATMAIHYRLASPEARRMAHKILRDLLKEYPHLRLLSGKKIWELLPASEVSKWTAIQFILDQEQRTPQSRRLVFYLGDDATDELVFSQMKGVSVAVGKRRRTAAAFFLESTTEVHRFLEMLCDFGNSDGPDAPSETARRGGLKTRQFRRTSGRQAEPPKQRS